MAKKRKQGNFISVLFFMIFALAGFGMLIGGFVTMAKSSQFRKTAVEITGTITDITSRYGSDGDVHHSVRVSYSYNGQDFDNVTLGFYSSNMYEGKDIILLVDPENPAHMTSKSGDTLTYVLLLFIGVIFAAVGIIPIIVSIIGSRKSKKLMENGRQLHAVVEYTDLNRSVRYNGRHPYIVFCTYQDLSTDVTYRFKSKNLMRDPGYAPGDPIEVFVDPQDYSKYTVIADGPDHPKIIDYT
ncbi:MAG: DUF3592 domain-containing protein [Acetatifactor sp.]|nr:DUF3592 domain-containing protein [Acetatifactor sp.]